MKQMKQFFVFKFKDFSDSKEKADAIVYKSVMLQIYEPVYVPWSFHLSPLECASSKDFDNESSYPNLTEQIGEPKEPELIQLDVFDSGFPNRHQFSDSTFVVTQVFPRVLSVVILQTIDEDDNVFYF